MYFNYRSWENISVISLFYEHIFPFQTTPAPSNDNLRLKPLNSKSERSNVENNHQSEATEDGKIVDANDRNVRSAKTCGSCQCTEKSSDEVELISCNIKEGFIEISNIDYEVADLTQLFSKQTGKQVDIIIKDTMLETVKGLESAGYIRNLIMENNAKLVFQSRQSPLVLESLHFRMAALKEFHKNVFKAINLTFSYLKTSSISDFASKDTWLELGFNIDNILFEGEFSSIQSFEQFPHLENVTMSNVFSNQPELLPNSFLQKVGTLKVLCITNSMQVSLPNNFLSQNGAKDVSIFLHADNVRPQSIDVKIGLKSLNGKTLTDSEKDILTGTSDSRSCASLCANGDCKTDSDEISAINCAICIRNKEGPNQRLESDLCSHKPTTVPPQDLPTVSMPDFVFYEKRTHSATFFSL